MAESENAFYGAVVLQDWSRSPDGISRQGFIGRVEIVAAESALGFRTASSESNWMARVSGATQVWSFPGCQVRTVVRGRVEPSSPDYWEVP